MFSRGWWGGGQFGPGWWGPGATIPAPVAGKGKPGVGRRVLRAWLAAEMERSVLDDMKRQGLEQLQLAVNLRRMQAEAFKQQLVNEQIEQARTAITAVFLAEA